MGPLGDLTTLLTQSKATTGAVVSLAGKVAHIATSSGMIQATAGKNVFVGTRVRVVDGVAYRTLIPSGVYPV